MANSKEDILVSITQINGLLLKKMIVAGANELNSNKQLVDSMNVFPVPDGDTGTNMSLTALAAAKETEKSSSLSVGEISKLAANGSLRGARGNSGVILSQLFRGFSKGLEGLEYAGTKELAKAIRKGVETAYKAVMKPKEGTILTVARSCAEAAEKFAPEIDDIEIFIEKVIEEAHKTLLQTKEMLPVLKQADVVDAGGKGLLCILEGAYKNINNDKEITSDEPSKGTNIDYSALTSVENQSITFGYCTEFFINVKNSDESTVNLIKNYLSSIGDSLVVVNDEDIIKIHVHTDHPGLAIEKALTIGSLSGLKIDNMRQQHTSKIDFASNEKSIVIEANEEHEEIVEKEIGFVSISMGSGLSEIFTNLGVDIIIEGGQTMNPSTEDILNAIDIINAKNIIILPNNKNIILAAEQASKLCNDKKVYVLPTATVPEGIAAMFNFEAGKDLEETLVKMKESIKYVKTGMVTYAVRDTEIGDIEISKGDILGMLGGEIAVVANDIADGTKQLIDMAVTEDNDMVSIYYGSDIREEDAEGIMEYINENYSDCEVEIHCGNQPLYYYIISVE